MPHSTHIKSPFEPKWFWDFDYDKINWQASYKTIIARIIERGGEKEWQELMLFYGQDKVINALKKEIAYLPEYAIDKVSSYFSIPKEQMLCYTRKLSRPGRWI